MAVFLTFVLPALLLAKTTPKGSPERALAFRVFGMVTVLALANAVLCLVDSPRQWLWSSLFLVGILLVGPWAPQKQKALRKADPRHQKDSR